ncbi:MAG: lytic murein transglycosylase, partial [Psychrobacter sp.]
MMLKRKYIALFPVLVVAGCVSQQATQKTSKPVRQGNVEITQTETVQVKPTPQPVAKPQTVAKPSYNSFYDW